MKAVVEWIKAVFKWIKNLLGSYSSWIAKHPSSALVFVLRLMPVVLVVLLWLTFKTQAVFLAGLLVAVWVYFANLKSLANWIAGVSLGGLATAAIKIALLAFLTLPLIGIMGSKIFNGTTATQTLERLPKDCHSLKPLYERWSCDLKKLNAQLFKQYYEQDIVIAHVELVGFSLQAEETSELTKIATWVLDRELKLNQLIDRTNQNSTETIQVKPNQATNGLTQSAFWNVQRPTLWVPPGQNAIDKFALAFGKSANQEILNKLSLKLEGFNSDIPLSGVLDWAKSQFPKAVSAKLLIYNIEGQIQATLEWGDEYWEVNEADLAEAFPQKTTGAVKQNPSATDQMEIRSGKVARLMQALAIQVRESKGQILSSIPPKTPRTDSANSNPPPTQSNSPSSVLLRGTSLAARYLYYDAWKKFTEFSQFQNINLSTPGNLLETATQQMEQAASLLIDALDADQQKLLWASSYFALLYEGNMQISEQINCTEIGGVPPNLSRIVIGTFDEQKVRVEGRATAGYKSYWDKRIAYYQRLFEALKLSDAAVRGASAAPQNSKPEAPITISQIAPNYRSILSLRLANAFLCRGNYPIALAAYRSALTYWQREQKNIARQENDGIRAFLLERMAAVEILDDFGNNPTELLDLAIDTDGTYLPAYFRRIEFMVCFGPLVKPDPDKFLLSPVIDPCQKYGTRKPVEKTLQSPIEALKQSEELLSKVQAKSPDTSVATVAPYQIMLFQLSKPDGWIVGLSDKQKECIRLKSLYSTQVLWSWVAQQPQLYTDHDSFGNIFKGLERTFAALGFGSEFSPIKFDKPDSLKPPSDSCFAIE